MNIMQLIREYVIIGSNVFVQLFGGLTTRAAYRQFLPTALTYGPSIAIDAALSNAFVVSVTDAVAFVFAAPTNPPASTIGQTLSLTIRNTSGGATGAGTFNAIFKTSAAVPAIATGNSRTIMFQWNGTNWVEVFRTAADVSN